MLARMRTHVSASMGCLDRQSTRASEHTYVHLDARLPMRIVKEDGHVLPQMWKRVAACSDVCGIRCTRTSASALGRESAHAHVKANGHVLAHMWTWIGAYLRRSHLIRPSASAQVNAQGRLFVHMGIRTGKSLLTCCRGYAHRNFQHV